MQPDQVWKVAEEMQGQIAAEIRVMLGESPLAQSMFDDAQKARRIEAMQKCAAESTDDATRHEAWMKMHVESGWVYGEQFDPVAKTHPNLKPWDELPTTTRSKAKIFDIVAKAAAKLVAIAAAFMLMLLLASDASACHRCGRSACLYVKPVVAAVAAPVQSVTQTDVYVVQNNAATPLVAQGTSAIVSNGGYQSQVLPLFDPNRYVSQRLELQKAVNATGAIENERTSNLVERLVALQAPAVERLAAGQAAQMVLSAAGLSEPNQAQSSAVVITNRNGVIQTMQLAPDQVQALTSQITTTTSQVTQSITTTPSAPLAQVQGKYPMLTQFCGKCHGTDVAQPKGGLYLGDDPNVVKEMRAKWFNVTDALSSGSMPPATAPQPTQEQKFALLNEMQAIIKAAPQ